MINNTNKNALAGTLFLLLSISGIQFLLKSSLVERRTMFSEMTKGRVRYYPTSVWISHAKADSFQTLLREHCSRSHHQKLKFGHLINK